MARLIPIDGSQGEGGGQVLRTALALSAVTGQGFEITKIRARRAQPGLRPQHLAAVRAAALVSQARVGGAYDGSPDLRFEPGALQSGDFRFEIATAGAATYPVPSAITAMVAPTRISSPSTARIDSRTPATGASTSWVAFSASISTITSPAATESPSDFSQRAIVPYSISSEIGSSFSSTATAR